MMRWTYDLDARALYVVVAEGTAANQEELPDGLIVDLDVAGNPIGIEVLRPQAGWNLDTFASRFLIDEGALSTLRWFAATGSFAVPAPALDGRISVGPSAAAAGQIAPKQLADCSVA